MKMLRLFLALLFIDFPGSVRAETNEALEFFDFERATLEQALNRKTDIATLSPLSVRESPGIITIVSKEEIQNSGARNLIDVLRLVPGFEFGVDVTGVIGIGFRGIWGQEGKILLMVDGQEYNDLGYAGTQLDRIPVQQIERVEIIRGPGSVIYGGNAEVAVINVITRDWRDKGFRTVASYGRTWYGGDDRSADFHYGGESNGLLISAAIHASQTERSDRNNTDLDNESNPMRRNSDLKSKSVNLGLQKSGFHGRFIADELDTTQRDSFGDSQPRATQVNSYLYLGELSYDLKLGDKLTLTPKLNMNHQRPYNERDEFFLYDRTFNRYREGMTAKYDFDPDLSLLGGIEYQQDRAKASDDTPTTSLFQGGNRQIGYENQAYFAQGQYASSFGTLVAGGRYEYHSSYKESLVPRVAWTKAWDKLNLKALFSKAFRAPSIENIALNPNIRPEYVTTFEFETGYQFTKKFFSSLAIFDMTIYHPIVYHNDPTTNTEFYSNDYRTGTRGFEWLARWKGGYGYTDISYSFYSATKNTIPTYSVPGHSDALLAWPTQKVTVNSSLSLGHGYSIDPSGVVLADRYAFYAQDASGNPIARRMPTAVLINIFLQKKDVFVKDLDIGLGVYDLFESNYSFIQPYNSGHSPLPGPSREVALRASYKFQ